MLAAVADDTTAAQVRALDPEVTVLDLTGLDQGRIGSSSAVLVFAPASGETPTESPTDHVVMFTTDWDDATIGARGVHFGAGRVLVGAEGLAELALDVELHLHP